MNTKITVDIDKDSEDYSNKFFTKLFTVVFTFNFDEFTNYTFTSTEPYLLSLNDWKSLLSENAYLNLYCGNGEGSIKRTNDCIRFLSNTSGAGGDTNSSFIIKIGPELKTELENMISEMEKIAVNN